MRKLILAALVLCSGVALADEADVHYRQGLALKKQGKMDEAIAEFHEAIKLRGNYAAAEFSLGIAYKARNDLDKAAEHLQKAIRMEPKAADMRSSLGITYYK